MLIKLRPFGVLVKEGAEIFKAYRPGGKLVYFHQASLFSWPPPAFNQR